MTNTPTWTETPPQQEGWYWKLEHGVCTIVEVKRQPAWGNRLCCLHGANYGPTEEYAVNALWSGPIQEPMEP